MFLRNEGTAPPPLELDETSSAHGASRQRIVFGLAWRKSQETFVWVASAIKGFGDPVSALVRGESRAGTELLADVADCPTTPRAARTASSILARTFRACRVRFTSERSTLAPVVRIRVRDVGPHASSRATHARPRPPNIAPAVAFAHAHSEAPIAARSTAGIVTRSSQSWLGQTTTDSKSCK